ncbi:3685_t:CDS:2, partial [Racocetra persica]
NKNLLKLGFQCTYETTTTEIELNLSVAVKICYQTIFKTKTEYSENLSVVVINIGDLDE